MRHILGLANPVGDALSCPSLATLQLGIDYSAMATLQQSDQEVHYLRTASTSLQLADVSFHDQGVSLLCDISQGHPRPYVPAPMRKEVFRAVHELSHPSINSTVKLVSDRFTWHGAARDIRRWAKEGIKCQTNKIHQHTKTPVEQCQVPQRRFDHIHVDIVGPFPRSQGATHLLTVIDRFTRWPAAIPLSDTSAQTCARALLAGWIADHGVPADITTDRGAQFSSQLWNNLAQLLGCKLHHTTAYHPQANGLVERMHRQLKCSLKARLKDTNWLDQLPWTLLGLRTTPKVDINATPADMVFGSALTVPADFLGGNPTPTAPRQHLRQLRDKIGNLAPPAMSHHNKSQHTIHPDLHTAQFVFVLRGGIRKALQPPYEGPFRVLERNQKTFILDWNGRPETVSIDRLKAAYVDESQPVAVAQPRKRGRPAAPK